MTHRNGLRTILALVVIAVALVGCGQTAPAEETSDTAAPRRVPVEVALVETGNIASTFAYTGDLLPVDELSLSSVVNGVVEEIFVEVGDRVRAGDPILQVEDTTYRAQVKQAKSALAMAQINKLRMENGPREEQIAMAQSGLIVAETNLQRLENGPRSEQIGIARAALDGAQAQLDSILTVTEDERTLAASALAQAEAGLRLAQSEYDKIKWAGQVGATPQALQLQQATIAYETALASFNRQVNPDGSDIAPLQAGIRQAALGLELAVNPFTNEDFQLAQAGVMQAQAQLDMAMNPFTEEDMLQAEAGIQQAEAAVALAQFQLDNTILRAPFDGLISEVNASTGSFASPQSPGVKLISTELELEIQIPEKEVASVFEGQPAAIRVAAYPAQDFPAVVTVVAPAADTTSHTFPVIITPLDEAKQLMAGMFADVTLLTEEKVGVVLVPRSAVAFLSERDVVYVVTNDESTVEERTVTLGLSDASQIEITSGLQAGETIIVSGLSSLGDGSAIEIVGRTE